LLERQKDNWVCGANNSPHEGKKDRGGVLQVQPLLRGNLNRSITRRHLASCEASRPPRHKSIEIVTFNVMIGAWVAIPREGACLTNSINRMRIAGFALAFAICCGVTEASAQLRAYVDVGGPEWAMQHREARASERPALASAAWEAQLRTSADRASATAASDRAQGSWDQAQDSWGQTQGSAYRC
jgi:hypothetical protein